MCETRNDLSQDHNKPTNGEWKTEMPFFRMKSPNLAQREVVSTGSGCDFLCFWELVVIRCWYVFAKKKNMCFRCSKDYSFLKRLPIHSLDCKKNVYFKVPTVDMWHSYVIIASFKLFRRHTFLYVEKLDSPVENWSSLCAALIPFFLSVGSVSHSLSLVILSLQVAKVRDFLILPVIQSIIESQNRIFLQ